MALRPGDNLLIDKLAGYFAGRGAARQAGKPDGDPSLLESRGLGKPWRMAFRDAGNYIVPAALDRAAYVSLLLGQPLLLAGEPGAGKSDFARKLAHIYNLDDVQEVHVKTTTLGRDLLYGFDDIARFRDANPLDRSAATKPRTVSGYIQFYGLGRAILRSAGPDYEVTPVGRTLGEIYDGPLPPGAKGVKLSALFPAEFGAAEGQDPAKKVTGKERTVVLVDEIDKAQRDTPNDLLDVIERMRFPIPELGITIAASEDHWPIVVITSNAERVLPAPFLRRCIFHRLVTPEDEETLKTILGARMTEHFSAGPVARDALTIFLAMRKQCQRPPGLSELLAWCLLLHRLEFDKRDGGLPTEGEKDVELLETSLSALSKSDADFEVAKRVLAQWRGKAGAATAGAAS